MEVRSIFKPHLLILFQYCSRAEPSGLKRALCSVIKCEFFCIGALALAGTENKRVFLMNSISALLLCATLRTHGIFNRRILTTELKREFLFFADQSQI